VICGGEAAGPCASCHAPVCADCSVLTEGGAATWAICRRCQAAGGSSLRGAWLRLALWVLVPVLVLAALTFLLLAVARAAEAAPDPAGALRAQGLGEAARVLDRRARQKQPKMKLSPGQARALAEAILRRVPDMPRARALHDVMPRSFVELMRAVEERGLAPAEAEAMAAYLTGLCAALRFGNPVQFDENHSHVIGREWAEIDYSGEGTTWQRQRAAWLRHGVADFKKAEHLHRYFGAEEKPPYFRRIYRPRGRMADVPPPAPPATDRSARQPP
jgi:hypothetical protein